jgi:2-aminoadipate transaminase
MRLDTDPYLHQYAQRVGGLSASAIRALFAVASRPEVVSFAGGMPATEALDFAAVQEVVQGVLTDNGPLALQYGVGQGRPELREQLVQVMAHEGVPAHPDDLVVTVGGQQALELVGKCFIDPGDIVLAEGPTYVGGLTAFGSHQADVRHVPMDDDGMQVEVLEDRLDQLAREGRRAKFVYTIPNHQNPAGVCMSEPRRHRLAELAETHDLLVVEDNPYGLIDFQGHPRTSIRSLVPDRTIYLSTMSKTFSPGVRTGWIAAPEPVRNKLILLREAADLCPGHFTQMVVERWLQTQPWTEQVTTFTELYRDRANTMLSALAEEMPPGVSWTVPTGGLFVWMTVPDGVDTPDLLARAVQERVAYVPGDGFYATGEGRQQMRLNYSYPTPDRIREGVVRLADLVTREVELVAAVYGDRSPGTDRPPPRTTTPTSSTNPANPATSSQPTGPDASPSAPDPTSTSQTSGPGGTSSPATTPAGPATRRSAP